MSELDLLIKKIFYVRNVSSRDVARSLGMSESYFSLIKNGKRPLTKELAENINELLALSEEENKKLEEFFLSQPVIMKKLDIKKETLAMIHQFFIKLQTGYLDKELRNKITTILNDIKE